MSPLLTATLCYVSVALSILLFLTALFLDRLLHKNRLPRRCPKCWYNLAGTPASLTCSECGHVAKSEKRLHKPRRHTWVAVLSLILLLIPYFLPRLRAISRDGWPAAVPYTVTIFALPWLEPHAYFDDSIKQGRQSAAWRIADALDNAVGNERLWNWQWHLMLSRILSMPPDRLEIHEASGMTWYLLNNLVEYAKHADKLTPSDIAFLDSLATVHVDELRPRISGSALYGRAVLESPCFAFGSYRARLIDPSTSGTVGEISAYITAGTVNYSFVTRWSDGLMNLGTPPTDATTWTLRAELEVFDFDDTQQLVGAVRHTPRYTRTFDVAVPIQPALGLNERVMPFVDAGIDAALRSLEHPQAGRRAGLEGNLPIVIGTDVDGKPDENEVAVMIDVPSLREVILAAGAPTIALRIELYSHAHRLATGSAWWAYGDREVASGLNASSLHLTEHVPLRVEPGVSADDLLYAPGLTLRLTGDPAIALRNPNATAYWSGSIDLHAVIARR